MTAHARTLDSDALYVALDRKRRDERLSWREVQRQAGIPTSSTATRLGRDHSLSADNLVRFLVWLGDTDVAQFVIKDAPGLYAAAGEQ